MRGRELGRVPEPAILSVEEPEQGIVGVIEGRLREFALPRGSAGRALKRLQHPAAGLLEFLPPCLPDPANPRDKVYEAGHPVAALLRDITRRKERSPIVGHEDGEGPSYGNPAQHMGGIYVDLVDVGPLFAVHLDADKDVV